MRALRPAAMGRAACCDKAAVKRGPWSGEEDTRLRSYIEQNGTGGSWMALPRKAGLRRCGKSCRLRWLNYLRPDIRRGGFSDDEDRLICALYAAVGSRWSLIAAHLPGRTDNHVKNYWNTRLKKKLLAVAVAGNGNSAPLPLTHGHHYAASVSNAALYYDLTPPLSSSIRQTFGTIGSTGVQAGAGDDGESIGMASITNAATAAGHGVSYDAFAAGEPAACTIELPVRNDGAGDGSELDEIFRSMGSTSGGGGDLSQCTEKLLNCCEPGDGGMPLFGTFPFWLLQEKRA